MRNRLLLSVVVLTLIIYLTGCYSKKPLNYFTTDRRDSSHNKIWQSYEPRIRPSDRLYIYVTALNPESAKPYNLSSGLGTAVLAQSQGISVDPDGKILYPQLGFIKVAGLTKNELRDTLLNRLKIYLTDPIVTVDFMNFKVTVLGEVLKQGPITVNDGKITLLEALGAAGDITITGRRDSVLVIREVNGRREFGSINLLSNELFKSPYYVLQQDDVVYVPMTERKVVVENEQLFVRRLSVVTSVLAVASTLGLLILNLTR